MTNMGAAHASELWVNSTRLHGLTPPKMALSTVTPVWRYITYNLQENTKGITQGPCKIKSEERSPVQP